MLPERVDQTLDLANITDAIRAYITTITISKSGLPILNTLWDRIGKGSLRSVNYSWAEDWVRKMKQEEPLSSPQYSPLCRGIGALF
ncbi:hypothetical protein QU481_03700 [Crenobacter sp. SG2303]|uniref:Uncharacterized protein n=1 Tax=Crenobacter oryzisoli TaxID=3056844 RepID=A0ABT7XJP6_9NEIS|nr:hypothetical protein [Crenobacter sp. SG2303]MDN0073993.1 hypothetical protein [Crenobacter sp. SG2303]